MDKHTRKLSASLKTWHFFSLLQCHLETHVFQLTGSHGCGYLEQTKMNNQQNYNLDNTVLGLVN